ncbi:MAG: SRPBCC family protein [Methylococcales bacterium]
MFKIIAIIIVVLIAAVLIYAATRPDTFRVARSIRIQAPPEKVFPLVSDLRNWNIWNPFAKKDLDAKGTYSGAASGVGSAYAWEGNKNVGKGSMEVAELRPPSEVVYKLDFISPFEAHNTATFTLTPQGENTQVTWAMSGPQPFIAKLMSVFMDCEKMVGPDFEAGLADLKVLAEK